MPGRYLLIEFDDDNAASSLRAQIDAASRKGKKYRVVGLFARPGKTCVCFIDTDTRSKDQVKRGSKFGWWLCTACGKPRLGDHQLQNMIEPDEVIEPNTFDGVDARYFVDPGIKPYIRHINSITFPLRVAQPAKDDRV